MINRILQKRKDKNWSLNNESEKWNSQRPSPYL
jgi:hypothetical protein